MTLSIVVIILSFLSESIVTNFIPINTNFFYPLFTIVSLIIIYPYFTKEDITYYKVCFVLGLIYDITFTDLLFLNALLFVLIGFFIRTINIWLSNNIINVGFMTIFVVVIYRVLNYGILLMMGTLQFDVMILLKSIYSSFVLNIVYIMLLYFITDKISKKRKILKID